MSMVSLTIAPLLKTYDKHWGPTIGVLLGLPAARAVCHPPTAALVYTGILTWEDPIGQDVYTGI